MSDDGQYVAFTSDANSSKLVPDWSSGQIPGDFASSQVYVWDRLNPDPNTAVKRASLGPDSTANGDAGSPAISADGTYVAFASTAVNLVIGASLPPCIDSCPPQIYRYNRVDGTIVLVSRVPADLSTQIIGSDFGATQPAISSDGSQIAFVTRSTNLLTTRPAVGGAAADGDIMVADVDVAEIYRASVLPDGVTPAPAANAHPEAVVDRPRRRVRHARRRCLQPARARRRPTRCARSSASPSNLSCRSPTSTSVPASSAFRARSGSCGCTTPGPARSCPTRSRRPTRDFGITFGECVDGYAVPPGGSCALAVILTPSVEGRLSGAIKISETGFGALNVQSQITGAGGLPALSADQASYHHFETLTGRRDQRGQHVHDLQRQPRPRLRHQHLACRAPTRRTSRSSGRSAATSTSTISAGCTVDVAFTPKEAGHRSATLVVGTDTGQYTSVLVDGDAHYTPTIQAGAQRRDRRQRDRYRWIRVRATGDDHPAVGRRRRATHDRRVPTRPATS